MLKISTIPRHRVSCHVKTKYLPQRRSATRISYCWHRLLTGLWNFRCLLKTGKDRDFKKYHWKMSKWDVFIISIGLCFTSTSNKADAVIRTGSRWLICYSVSSNSWVVLVYRHNCRHLVLSTCFYSTQAVFMVMSSIPVMRYSQFHWDTW